MGRREGDLRREEVIDLIKENGYNLRWLKPEFKNDKEILMLALRDSGSSIKYSTDEVKNDKKWY